MNTKDTFDNIILTEHFGMAMSRPDHDRRYERNRNVLVVGGSGSGKTRGFFEPNVMQMSANYVITDLNGSAEVTFSFNGSELAGTAWWPSRALPLTV